MVRSRAVLRLGLSGKKKGAKGVARAEDAAEKAAAEKAATGGVKAPKIHVEAPNAQPSRAAAVLGDSTFTASVPPSMVLFLK